MDTQEYLQGTIREYLKELSERKIVPGGGSASALSAALGAGLNLMVINYSMKPDDSTRQQTLLVAKEQQQESSGHLSLLVDEDCKAFQELMEELSSKGDAQPKYIAAARVPMEICRECTRSMNIATYLVENANRKIVTDVGCAAHILKAAFYSAQLNVEVNLKCIKDRLFVKECRKNLKTMRKEIDRAEKDVKNRLKKITKREG